MFLQLSRRFGRGIEPITDYQYSRAASPVARGGDYDSTPCFSVFAFARGARVSYVSADARRCQRWHAGGQGTERPSQVGPGPVGMVGGSWGACRFAGNYPASDPSKVLGPHRTGVSRLRSGARRAGIASQSVVARRAPPGRQGWTGRGGRISRRRQNGRCRIFPPASGGMRVVPGGWQDAAPPEEKLGQRPLPTGKETRR